MVDYHVYTGESLPPVASLAGYDYVLAGNGLFKRAQNALLSATIRTAAFKAPLLPTLEESLSLTHGRVPGRLMGLALKESREMAEEMSPRETLFLIRYDPEAQTYTLEHPETEVGTFAGVEYRVEDPTNILVDLHSHHNMAAWFSETDDRDEQGLRVYGVLGRVGTRPELALRVGIYGHHGAIRAEDVFDGVTSLVEEDGGSEPRDLKEEAGKGDPTSRDPDTEGTLVLTGKTAQGLFEQLRRCWEALTPRGRR
ncbi:MAG: hypothetical protein HYT87_13055 [Nitrospirae bacterium]|nr:hypothetical protein [Nitrospirota bacterium]